MEGGKVRQVNTKLVKLLTVTTVDVLEKGRQDSFCSLMELDLTSDDDFHRGDDGECGIDR